MSNKTQVSDKEMDSVSGGTTREELKMALNQAKSKLADGAEPKTAFRVVNRALYLTDYEKDGADEGAGKSYTAQPPKGK